MIAEALAWLTARIMPPATIHSPRGAAFAVLHEGQSVEAIVGAQACRRHAFQDLEDFARFVNRRLDPLNADVLFDGQKDLITASSAARTLDPDVITCLLHYHPRWKRWAALLDKVIDQRTLYRHLIASPAEDSEVVETPAGPLGRAHLLAATEIGAVRVVKGSTFTGDLDPKGFYRVRDMSQQTEVSARIPSTLAIDLPFYRLGEPEYDSNRPTDERGATYRIELDLEVITEGEAPRFRLTAPGLDLVKHAAQVDALNLLRKRMDPGFLVGLGAYSIAERSL